MCYTALFSLMCIHALSHHQSHAHSNTHPNIISIIPIWSVMIWMSQNDCPPLSTLHSTLQKNQPHQNTSVFRCVFEALPLPSVSTPCFLLIPSDAESWMASCSFNWPQSFAKASRHRCSRTCAAMAWWSGVDERCGFCSGFMGDLYKIIWYNEW